MRGDGTVSGKGSNDFSVARMAILAAGILLVSCSGGETPLPGTGATGGKGGALGTGSLTGGSGGTGGTAGTGISVGTGGSTGTGGTAGTGISVGTGGHGGTGTGGTGTGGTGTGGTGTGGAGGTGTNPQCDLPACLTDFTNAAKACAPEGACVQQQNTGSATTTVNACWANGVKEHVTVSITAQGASGSARVTNSSGGLCYSFDFTADGGGGLGPLTFRDAAGKSLFMLTDNGDGTVTVACSGGPTKVVSAACNAGMDMMMPGMADTMCTPGTCM
jgi:hypothetical protein